MQHIIAYLVRPAERSTSALLWCIAGIMVAIVGLLDWGAVNTRPAFWIGLAGGAFGAADLLPTAHVSVRALLRLMSVFGVLLGIVFLLR